MPVVSEQTLQDAISAYERGQYPSLNAVATAFKVSRHTLTRRLRGGNTRKQAREAQQVLSHTQEQLLVRWITDLDAAGASPSFTQIREYAELISLASGGPPSVGHNWIQRFLKRQPDVRSKVNTRKRADFTSLGAESDLHQADSDQVKRGEA